jgi:6,7-dimethyl-8-ribityllumazine synthase
MSERTGAVRPVPSTRYAIVASRWNPRIVDALVAARLASAGQHAAIIALGCVVRGDTRHYEHVADGCANGLMRVALDFRIPVLNGVLAVEKHADAEARAGGARGNKGEDVALAALEMADLVVQLADE